MEGHNETPHHPRENPYLPKESLDDLLTKYYLLRLLQRYPFLAPKDAKILLETEEPEAYFLYQLEKEVFEIPDKFKPNLLKSPLSLTKDEIDLCTEIHQLLIETRNEVEKEVKKIQSEVGSKEAILSFLKNPASVQLTYRVKDVISKIEEAIIINLPTLFPERSKKIKGEREKESISIPEKDLRFYYFKTNETLLRLIRIYLWTLYQMGKQKKSQAPSQKLDKTLERLKKKIKEIECVDTMQHAYSTAKAFHHEEEIKTPLRDSGEAFAEHPLRAALKFLYLLGESAFEENPPCEVNLGLIAINTHDVRERREISYPLLNHKLQELLNRIDTRHHRFFFNGYFGAKPDEFIETSFLLFPKKTRERLDVIQQAMIDKSSYLFDPDELSMVNQIEKLPPKDRLLTYVCKLCDRGVNLETLRFVKATMQETSEQRQRRKLRATLPFIALGEELLIGPDPKNPQEKPLLPFLEWLVSETLKQYQRIQAEFPQIIEEKDRTNIEALEKKLNQLKILIAPPV